MKQSFEKLIIWQNTHVLAKNLGLVFYHKECRNFGFQDQIMRAVISISNNIAEGNDRESIIEFMRYLYIAKGSAAEVKNMLYLAQDFDYITAEQFIEFEQLIDTILNQIGKLLSILKLKK